MRRILPAIISGFALLSCGEPTDSGDSGEPTFEITEQTESAPEDAPSACELVDDGYRCPFDCESPADWPEEWHQRAERLIDEVNQRRTDGVDCSGESVAPVGELDYDERLAEAARCHALDMGEEGFFDHHGTDESTEVDRAQRAGYDSPYVGENLATGQHDHIHVVDAWVESPGHCVNLMHDEYRDTGAAYVKVGGTRYWVQVYGMEM